MWDVPIILLSSHVGYKYHMTRIGNYGFQWWALSLKRLLWASTFLMKINAFKLCSNQSHVILYRVSSYPTWKPSISHHSSHSTIVFNMNNLLVFKSKSYQFSKHFMSCSLRCFKRIYIIWTFKTNSHQERKFHIIHALKLTSF